MATKAHLTIDYANAKEVMESEKLGGLAKAGNGLYPTVLSEEYEGIPIKVERMDYLFLPTDAKPSEEDQKRLEEGSLEISYGTDKEERTVFLGATWEEDEIKYLLFTMKGGFSEEDLLAKAKEVIDVER